MPLPPYQPMLKDDAKVSRQLLSKIETDYHRFAERGLPEELEDYLLETYALDVSSTYAGLPIKNPWGKASGQLSMAAHQVAEDIAAGLGFIVLKTVIAQDVTGTQTMSDWAIPEARMAVERISDPSGEVGWTVSWKGRGWWQSFEEYLELVQEAQTLGQPKGILIVPSCKFHLPTVQEPAWKTEEYEYTVPKLVHAWQQPHTNSRIMPLEKDFSPTLAGSDKAAQKTQILTWLQTVPRLIRAARIESNHSLRIGLKLFNTLFEDEFQLEMLRQLHQPGDHQPDFYIYGNRLFDPHRSFAGHTGIAYGGPELSNRNLRVMQAFQCELAHASEVKRLEWSATGNIATGRMALEYALCGASSFQLHTFFQLPNTEYRMPQGNRTTRALHELYFHPQTGLIVWMHHLANILSLDQPPIRLTDISNRRLDPEAR